MKTMKIHLLLAGITASSITLCAQVNPGIVYLSKAHNSNEQTKEKKTANFPQKAVGNKKQVQPMVAVKNYDSKPATAGHTSIKQNYSPIISKRQERTMERRKLRKEAKLNRKVEQLVLRITGGYGYFSAP